MYVLFASKETVNYKYQYNVTKDIRELKHFKHSGGYFFGIIFQVRYGYL